MNFTRVSLRRPVATLMAYLAVLATGLFSVGHLPLELTPEVDFPRLSVVTQWPESSPEMVELFVSSPIEAVAATVAGVRSVRSTSEESQSTVEIEFERGTKMDFAAFELNEKLALVREELPYGSFPPQIRRYVPREFQTDVFLSYRLIGPFDLQTLRRLAQERVRPPLLAIDGVADVHILGGVDRELHIELDAQRLEALGLTPQAVEQTLRDLGLRQAAGHLVQGGMRTELIIDQPVQGVDEIRSAPIPAHSLASSSGAPARLVRLGEVAWISDASGEPRGLSRINGQPAVTINVEREPGTSTIAVAEAVERKVAALQKELPPGLRLLKERDESQRLRKELRDLTSRAGFCLVMIFGVLLLFFRHLSAPLVILSTIAFSVLLTVDFFYLSRLSLNLLTLAGLALGFGMLVDNSIVVLDSIERQWRHASSSHLAAEKGTSAVALALVASTVTTVVVFFPFLYMTGELRLYYVPFALAVGLALLSSLVVAFTLTPVLATRLLPGHQRQTGPRTHSQGRDERPNAAKEAPGRTFDQGGNRLSLWPRRAYRSYLVASLRHPGAVALCALAIFVGSFYLFDKKVPRGQPFAWGRDTYLVVYVQMPSGSELEMTDAVVRSFEQAVVGRPHLEKVTAEVYPDWAWLRITFPPEVELSPEPLILKEELIAMAAGFAGATVNVYGFGPGFFRGGGAAPSFYLQVLGYNYNEVKRIAEEVGRTLQRNVRVRDLETSSTLWFGRKDLFEVVLRLDRQLLNRYGFTVEEVLEKIHPHLRGTVQYQRLRLQGQEVDYRLKMRGYREFDLEDLRNLVLRSQGQEVVRLADVGSVSERKAMARIVRENQQYQRWISFEFRGPWRMGERLVESVIRGTHLPPGYSLQRPTYFFQQQEEKRQITAVLALAIILVFMVTAALYESFRQPFVVLLTVPLALIGVFWIFFLTNTPFDRSAYIGVILLAGIVVNNAIVLVDRVNRLRGESGSWREAIMQGCAERARPILMTTATTVFGMLPLVLFVENKQGLWYALALATIGGLSASCLLVLTVTPALYALFELAARKRGQPGG